MIVTVFHFKLCLEISIDDYVGNWKVTVDGHETGNIQACKKISNTELECTDIKGEERKFIVNGAILTEESMGRKLTGENTGDGMIHFQVPNLETVWIKQGTWLLSKQI